MVNISVPSSTTLSKDHNAPQQNTYRPRMDGGGGISAPWDIAGGARITAQGHNTAPVANALAIGLGEVAGGIGAYARMRAIQEERAENIDTLRAFELFQNDERTMFDRVSDMKSGIGYREAVPFAEKFYSTRGEDLIKSAKSERQKENFINFLTKSRDYGLNRVHSHKARELERYEWETWEGSKANIMALIERDPQNWRLHIDRLKSIYDNINTGAHPEIIRARHREAEEAGFVTAVKALANTDRAAAYQLLEYSGDPEEGRSGTAGGLIPPLAGNPLISSGFGHRAAPMTPKGPGSSNHQGVDYAVPVGTEVMAAGDGKVIFVGDTAKGGNTIIIDHGNGLTTSYAHLNDFGGTKEGQQVKQGQQIALSGGAKDYPGAGHSTGAHLHFSVKQQDGQFVDPEKALSGPLPSVKAQLFEYLQRLDAQDLRMEEAALKKAGQEAEKELIDMRYGVEGSPPFSGDEVVARRDLLSPGDYEKWLKDAREGTPPPAHSNPETLITLYRMAVNGDPGLNDFADEELRAARLTAPDHRAALNEGQQFRDPAIKRGLEEIRLKTGYSEMNPNPDAASSFIQAKKDFIGWLDSPAGKKADDDGKLKMAGRIADNYRLVQTESLLTAPAPLFLVGSRTAPDIQKTLEATRAALEAGGLTEEEFAEQALRIKRLADILTQQQAAAEAAGAKQNGGRR